VRSSVDCQRRDWPAHKTRYCRKPMLPVLPCIVHTTGAATKNALTRLDEGKFGDFVSEAGLSTRDLVLAGALLPDALTMLKVLLDVQRRMRADPGPR
jgi:hypothetical protein